MEVISGIFSVKCNKCGKQHNFIEENVYFELVSTEEKEMGVENEHLWEESFTCDVCNNEIEIEYHVWEYPVGAFNHDDIIKSGTEIVNNTFVFDFNDDEDVLSEDDV